jgi:dihydrofolate reductase
MNAMPKYVASRTLKAPQWNNTQVLQGDVPSAVGNLKRTVAGEILVSGSRTLVNSLKQHKLIDEYRLMVFPVLLCSGMRLFEEVADATSLSLADVQRLPNGALNLTYVPVGA